MAAAVKKALVFLGKKIGSMLFSSGQEENKGCKKSFIVLLLVILLILMIPVLLITAVGVAVNEFLNGNEDLGMTLENRDTYRRIEKIYVSFNKDIEDKATEAVNDLEVKYTKVKIVNHKVSIIKPIIVKHIDINKPRYELVLAYLQEQYNAKMEQGEVYNFVDFDVLRFMKSCVTFSDSYIINNLGDENEPTEIRYYATVSAKTAEIVAEELFSVIIDQEKKKEKTDKFLLSYASYEGQVGETIEGSYENVDLGQFTIYPVGMPIPQFYQYDKRWGREPYGTGTISDSGCATTSFAMVVTYLNGGFVNPAYVASWSDEHGQFQPGAGTKWSFFSVAADKWRLVCSNLGKSSKLIIEKLLAGEPIIASMGPGEFTKGGHMIVLRGITAEGKILVVDPNDNIHKGHYKKEYNINDILREGKNFWSFKKKDG